MEALTRLDGDLKPQPALATHWEANGDLTEWTFHLRRDARWHNGDPVTAEDFVFAMKRILTPAVASPRAEILLRLFAGARGYYDAGGLDGDGELDSVEILDGGAALRFHMIAPSATFPVEAGSSPFVPVHRRTIEEAGDSWADGPATFVGNGPFRMVRWDSGRVLRVEPAETHWDRENIHWKAVEFVMIDSDSTAEAAFRSGEVDVIGLMPSHVDDWRGEPEMKTGMGSGIYYVAFNSDRAPLEDRQVRRALSKAINRTLITREITRTGEQPARGLVPDGVPSATEGRSFRELAGDLTGPADVEGARALMAEAGYTDDSPLPSLTYSYNSQESNKLIAEQIQRMWARLPVSDIRLNNMEWGVYLQEARAGSLQVFRMGWVVVPDALYFLEIFQSNHPNNYAGFRNEEYDGLIEEAIVERDMERRDELLVRAERLLVEEEAAIAPIYAYSFPYLVRRDIEGLEVNGLDGLTWVHARRR